MSKYTHIATEIEIANKTSRTRGAVGKNAVVPRMVRAEVSKLARVLDFGAGKDAAHAARLRADGFQQVEAYEFGANVDPQLHVTQATLAARYEEYNCAFDCVYASNVLNVQSNGAMLRRTLGQVAWFLHYRGMFICNYPQSPRKSELSAGSVESILGEYFHRVERQAGSTPVWICENKKG